MRTRAKEGVQLPERLVILCTRAEFTLSSFPHPILMLHMQSPPLGHLSRAEETRTCPAQWMTFARLASCKESVVYWLFIHSLIHKCSWYSISMNPKLKCYSVRTFTAMVHAHTYTCSKQGKQTLWHSFSCLGRAVRYSTSIINSSSMCLHTSSLATTGRITDTPIVSSAPHP